MKIYNDSTTSKTTKVKTHNFSWIIKSKGNNEQIDLTANCINPVGRKNTTYDISMDFGDDNRDEMAMRVFQAPVGSFSCPPIRTLILR